MFQFDKASSDHSNISSLYECYYNLKLA